MNNERSRVLTDEDEHATAGLSRLEETLNISSDDEVFDAPRIELGNHPHCTMHPTIDPIFR
jgi:hypothetical protein